MTHLALLESLQQAVRYLGSLVAAVEGGGCRLLEPDDREHCRIYLETGKREIFLPKLIQSYTSICGGYMDSFGLCVAGFEN